jgi:hypothetical protein
MVTIGFNLAIISSAIALIISGENVISPFKQVPLRFHVVRLIPSRPGHPSCPE